MDHNTKQQLRTADSRHLPATQGEEAGTWASIRETVKVGLQALLIALVVRTLLFQPFNIPSGSLIPTLLIGDYLFVSKYSYGYSKYSFPDLSDVHNNILNGALGILRLQSTVGTVDLPRFPDYRNLIPEGRYFATPPKLGDIAVFKLPRDNSTDYIKRVIGLPGDRIQVIDGVLNINGQAVKRERIADYETLDASGRPRKATQYLETLPNGSAHKIIEIDGDRGFWDNTELYTVPQNHFFMMGDNRDNSTDSRVPPARDGVGYVPYENLVGRAEMIFFSIDEFTPAWQIWNWPADVRWSRMFTTIH